MSTKETPFCCWYTTKDFLESLWFDWILVVMIL